ncbi:MAG: YbjN domain-containing protein [Planctomycetes bacterium]|nr:YbjN domain-containing protein [Planctomycetota bacterium]
MKGKDKIESYMVDLSLACEEVKENAWLINDEEKGLRNLMVMLSDPLVVIRVKVMDLPDGNREAFFEKLLRLNAEDLLHGAYALEGENVILIDTLELETMDFEEFRASLEAMGLALVQHYKVLSGYRRKE